MSTEHYFDQSATTRPSDAAVAALTAAAWGNPSSVHAVGVRAANELREARAAVGRTLGMPRFSQDRLIFTSCGTESNNIALLGCARAKKRDPAHPGTVILSAGEHPSLENPAILLEKEGYTVVRIPTAGGALDLDFLEKTLAEADAPVIFAGFMLVNNETGAVYDVKSAAALVKRHFPDAVVHCDAVQGYLKRKFTPMGLGVDTLTLSAHKVHAVRGAGALYVNAATLKRRNLTAVMPGGGQEGGFRSGTENLAAIRSFAAAAEEGFLHLEENIARTAELRRRLDEGLASLDVRLNRPAEGLDNIASVVLPGIRSETMLNELSGRGIYVSAGSACAANSKKKSLALEAFGVSASDADSTIRISLDYTNTEEDVAALLEGLAEGIASLQRKRTR
ncbi:MAG: aminotransferase class V-fold PLP-dependent enzyme [Clostridia bacterium]|nr:aminotransferase class V-fold PLP-dependent enzyme [Clostridia bacterium]MBR5365037.1 aminotransferase class V-fold PLP-dependent enzyme [Clostridia bacterium]